MKTLVISDLHLSACRSDLIELFSHFLDTYAIDADQLYILGDFFEYWIGSDVLNHHEIDLIHKLKAYKNKGKNIYFMHGNRDFLIDKQFEFFSGAKIIPEPYILPNTTFGNGNINNISKWVLCHGDALCTLDKSHQHFRKWVRHPITQSFFLKLPPFLRKKIARKLRSKSNRLKQKYLKNPEMYDVTLDAVNDILKKYESTILLHGHTHKMGIHNLLVEGKPCKRIVLGDWDKTGNFLEIANNQYRLVEFDRKKCWIRS